MYPTKHLSTTHLSATPSTHRDWALNGDISHRDNSYVPLHRLYTVHSYQFQKLNHVIFQAQKIVIQLRIVRI